ncbi:MAG: hypothetical protein ACRDGT_13265 [Candidatus Limnocylindria bacterium]
MSYCGIRFRQYPEALADAALVPARAVSAAKIAENVEYETYKELVEPYLDEEIAALYSAEDAWFDMRIRVLTQLRERAKV